MCGLLEFLTWVAFLAFFDMAGLAFGLYPAAIALGCLAFLIIDVFPHPTLPP